MTWKMLVPAARMKRLMSVAALVFTVGATATIASRGSASEATTNPIDGADMVWVPAGEFPMGSEGGQANEKPVHQVKLTQGFWLYKTPVTNAQYGLFLAANPQHDKPGLWDNPLYNTPPQPVTGVSWQDAQDYCAWARVSLPTEAQWEYAARGPEGRTYPWGEQAPDERYAVFGQSAGPEAVGSRLAGKSWCGALDMAGNVWQWCADWYDPGYYLVSPAVDPTGNANGSSKVLRGGSWLLTAFNLRAAYRFRYTPDLRLNYFFGFRCARTGS